MIRTSEYTKYLVIGFIAVFILRFFYNPLEVENVLIEEDDITLFNIFAPILVSLSEVISYVGLPDILFRQTKTPDNAYMCCMALIFIFYFFTIYIIEKIHNRIDGNDKLFTVCIDMLCIENICMYILKRRKINKKRVIILFAVIIICLIPLLFTLIIEFIYFFIGYIISISIPFAIDSILSNYCGEAVENIGFILSLLIFSQIVWRLCSDHIFNFLIRKISFGRLSIY